MATSTENTSTTEDCATSYRQNLNEMMREVSAHPVIIEIERYIQDQKNQSNWNNSIGLVVTGDALLHLFTGDGLDYVEIVVYGIYEYRMAIKRLVREKFESEVVNGSIYFNDDTPPDAWSQESRGSKLPFNINLSFIRDTDFIDGYFDVDSMWIYLGNPSTEYDLDDIKVNDDLCVNSMTNASKKICVPLMRMPGDGDDDENDDREYKVTILFQYCKMLRKGFGFLQENWEMEFVKLFMDLKKYVAENKIKGIKSDWSSDMRKECNFIHETLRIVYGRRVMEVNGALLELGLPVYVVKWIVEWESPLIVCVNEAEVIKRMERLRRVVRRMDGKFIENYMHALWENGEDGFYGYENHENGCNYYENPF